MYVSIIHFMALRAKKRCIFFLTGYSDFEHAKRCSLEFLSEWRWFQPSSVARLASRSVRASDQKGYAQYQYDSNTLTLY